MRYGRTKRYGRTLLISIFFSITIDLTGLGNITNVGAPQPTFALAMSYLGY